MNPAGLREVAGELLELEVQGGLVVVGESDCLCAYGGCRVHQTTARPVCLIVGQLGRITAVDDGRLDGIRPPLRMGLDGQRGYTRDVRGRHRGTRIDEGSITG